MSTMILAGDLGGTKTLLGLFEPAPVRPRPVAVRSFSTPAFTDLTTMVEAFASDALTRGQRIRSAWFGVAGPVLARTATLTNVPFAIDADAVAGRFGIPHVTLLNDLVAMAWSLRVLADDEIVTLQQGTPRPDGHLALIAAGTGFNEALVLHDGGRFVPTAAESGHSDWAARSDRDVQLLASLRERFGRAEVEHVLSGPGVANIHRVTHTQPCAVVPDVDALDAPSRISQAALGGHCPHCVEALQLFVEAYGAEAGNLALRTMATGGVFVGGGIAPKILPLLTDARFMRAFLDKGRFGELLAMIPVRIILNAEAGLLGAAVAAQARVE
jgi:glucokinase